MRTSAGTDQGMQAGSIERFSTAGTPAEARLDYWNALACETFNNLVVDSDEPVAFHGEMVRAALGEISLMSADSSAARVTRTNDPVRSTRASRNFDLHFQLSGRSLNRQAGREATLEAGQFTLCDASQPYLVQFTEANHMLCLKTPANVLEARLGDLDGLICMPMSAQRGGGAMLSSFLRTVWDQLKQGDGGEGWAETVSAVILDLMTLAYRPAKDAATVETLRASRRSEARSFINGRLCDPELGVGSVAEALGVSARYVQLLFAEAETTPSAYILDRRLDLAAERLRGQVTRGSVTQVALAVGFNDLTHFGRAFRRRFGVNPSDYSAGARAPGWNGKDGVQQVSRTP